MGSVLYSQMKMCEFPVTHKSLVLLIISAGKQIRGICGQSARLECRVALVFPSLLLLYFIFPCYKLCSLTCPR